jgi:hypothetical protein
MKKSRQHLGDLNKVFIIEMAFIYLEDSFWFHKSP